MARMKRLQISLEPEMDQQLGKAALELGISKAEYIRRTLREHLGAPVQAVDDPLFRLRFSSGNPRQPGESIDDLIYGPSRSRSRTS